MSNLIYLASPYSHPDSEVRHRRYLAACRATAEMLKDGSIVFSPIVYGHPMALLHDLPTGWDFWGKIDEAMLSRCDKVVVLKLDGWEFSKGVRAERIMAREHGMQVEFMEAV